MEDLSKPLISIPIPGPFFVLDGISLTILYAGVAYIDYYLYCHTSVPYQRYKNWHRIFHILIPFIFAPEFHASSTSYISFPWFIASVGAYTSEIYKRQQRKIDAEKEPPPQSFKTWIKSVGMEGLAENADRQPDGTTITTDQVRMEGVKRFLIGTMIMVFGSKVLTPLLLDDPATMFTFHWYSPQCMYYGFLMGFKGYTLMTSNDMILAAAQIVSGVRIINVFNLPFLATSPKDFWGNRWNLIVRNLFRKQLYNGKIKNDEKDNEGSSTELRRLRAFFISGLMHEAIMTLVNRTITLEQLLFFMISGIEVYFQSILIPKSIADRVPRFVSMVLTAVFLASTSKLFFGPFLRFEEQSVMFSKYAFV